MGFLVDVDLLEVLVEGVFEAGLDEIVLGVVGETVLVELPLKVLESQGIV